MFSHARVMVIGVSSDLKQSGEQQFIAFIEMVTLSSVIYSIIQELDRMLI